MVSKARSKGSVCEREPARSLVAGGVSCGSEAHHHYIERQLRSVEWMMVGVHTTGRGYDIEEEEMVWGVDHDDDGMHMGPPTAVVMYMIMRQSKPEGC